MKVETETRIGGIPSIVVGEYYPAEGDGWNNPYLPDYVEILEVLNMRGKPCKWREQRMTPEDLERIKTELICHEYA